MNVKTLTPHENTSVAGQNDASSVTVTGGGGVMTTQPHTTGQGNIFRNKWFMALLVFGIGFGVVAVSRAWGFDLQSHPYVSATGALVVGLILALSRGSDSGK